MAASTFDTLAAADQLRNAGFDERQARAIVSVQNSAHTTLATKTDLATEIDRSTTTMKAELATAIEPLATKAEFAAAIEPLATKADLAHLAEQVATLAGAFSMMKWTMGFIGVVMLAMAGRLFDIV